MRYLSHRRVPVPARPEPAKPLPRLNEVQLEALRTLAAYDNQPQDFEGKKVRRWGGTIIKPSLSDLNLE